jgi:tRNA-specific 2-thiouridylase
MIVEDLNWLGFDVPTSGTFRCAVQVRYRHRAAPATVHVEPCGTTARVEFDEPQMAVAPGQGAAFYELEADGTGGDLSLGGGWIRTARRGGLEAGEEAQAPLAP